MTPGPPVTARAGSDAAVDVDDRPGDERSDEHRRRGTGRSTGPARQPRLPPSWTLWSLAAVVTIVRWWYAADRRAFHLVPDEPSQLAMARWLGGGVRWNMFDHLTYRPGYAVVIAPLSWFVDGGAPLVRAVLVVNAVLAGASAVLLARLLRRWTESWAGHTPVVVIAGIVALAPAAISASAYTWAESFVTLVFLATLWWAQRVVDTARTVDALAAVISAGVAMTAHGRLLGLVPATVAVCAVVLGRRRRWGALTLSVAVAGVASGLSLWFTRFVHRAVWDDPVEVNGAAAVVERLDAPRAWLDAAVGQSWYQLVGSAGMVGVGSAVVAWGCIRPRDDRERRAALTIVTLTVPLVLTSIVFMADRDRADQLVYGRYVDAIAWPLVALGLASTWHLVVGDPVRRRGRWSATLGAAVLTVLTGAALAQRHGEQLADEIGLRMMVPALLPYVGRDDGVPVLAVTAVAVAVLLGVAAVAAAPGDRRGRGAILAAVLAGALVWSGIRVHDAQARMLNRWDIGGALARAEAILPDGESVGVVMVPDRDDPIVPWTRQRQRFQIYQLHLDDHELVWERSGVPANRFVFAPEGAPVLDGVDATIRWWDPAVRVGLWELHAVPDGPATGGERR